MNIYCGNLSFSASEDEIRSLFEGYGQVSSVAVIKDKMTGQSRGFAFIEMPNDSEAQAAITALNGKDFKNRNLVVNPARPREEGGQRRGGGGFQRGRSGGQDRRGGGDSRNRDW
jgi:RNA recognition motif-containing protein